ncbi:SEC-C domain-containing protein [Croceibacterium sp. LX-88]|uniref:SEC-C domain-containing protein n=1 Tax=Croceibacterium selenioxidans TaxID=2838833 RepID=A0ABS5W7Q7_9SPHN|nr:SEC-C domain-containing protein [Croceibacterium selenioxidans]
MKGGEIELLEKLGRNDPCPCGSGKSFQTLLPNLRPVSTARSGGTIGGDRFQCAESNGRCNAANCAKFESAESGMVLD